MSTCRILEHLIKLSGSFSRQSIAYTRRFSSSSDRFRKFDEATVERLPFGPKYFEWVEADYLDAPLDIHTRNVAESPLLSRNNVGMGFLVLNSKYTGISQINGLYRRLADLETNVYKRFVLVTSMTRETFSLGLNPAEIFMFLGSMQKLAANKNLAPYEVVADTLEKYLSNLADLSYLILSYKKPLIVYANGSTAGYGMCLASLSNASACYNHTKFKYSGYELGIPPLGGLSYVLGRLENCIGEYLSLTGEEIAGPDLVHSGLIKNFMSPDAIKVLQITSDRLVELPERETHLHLQEHFLDVDKEFTLKEYVKLINHHFGKESIEDIRKSLTVGAESEYADLPQDKVKEWENKTLEAISKNTDEFANVTLQLIKRVKSNLAYMFKTAQVTWPDYVLRELHNRTSRKKSIQYRMLYDAIMEEVLTDAINDEITAFCKVASKILGKNLYSQTSFSKNKWQPFERSGFAISSVIGLKRLHPDYNPETGCEYDKKIMERQVERWSDTFLQKELLMMKRIVKLDKL